MYSRTSIQGEQDLHGTIPKRRKRLSAVSSGRRLFADKDVLLLDNAHARRWHDLYVQYLDDLGGDDAVSEPVRSLIRRVATMQCVLEQREADYVRTGKQSRDQASEYQSLSTTLTRLMKTLGLIGPKAASTPDEDDGLDPLDYIKGKHTTKRSRLEDDAEDD